MADNEKSDEAFRTISEVADDLDLPQHVLRFWETRFAQIRPLKRGGGRRYYRPGDVELLRTIRHFLYGEGYTIKGVQRILKEQGPRALIAMRRGGPSVSLAGLKAEFEEPGGSISEFEPEQSQAEAVVVREVGMAKARDGHLGVANVERLRLALSEISACQRLLVAAREN